MKKNQHSFPIGLDLYERSKKVIVGGTNLLSKRPELWVIDNWPNYYTYAKGCKIVSVDGKKYYDFSTNSVGACTLGYNNKVVNQFVINAIRKSNTSMLNHPHDVLLAEKLIGIHPWATGMRFTRGGGEALAVAVRVARKVTSKTGVIVTGYHGWHDWYLAANIEGDALGKTGVHLKGLSAKGVPSSLHSTIAASNMYDSNSIRENVKKLNYDVAAIIIEISRYSDPPKNFLTEVQRICMEFNCILIVDEVTSGFRFNLGGLHLSHDLKPDIAVFAKALGNGFPIAATVMNKKTFDASKDTFISSTSWSENIGPTAAIKTIDLMQKLISWEKIAKAGQKVSNLWREEAEVNNIAVKVSSPSVNSIVKLDFTGVDAPLLKSIWCKLMLEDGFLDNGLFYPTVAHKKSIIDKYAISVRKNMKILKKISTTRNFNDFISEPAHESFVKI